MRTRPLGRTCGPDVSVVGLGCNNFGARLDEGRSRDVIEAALDVGINFFDTADVYAGGESERILGKVLGSRRPSVVIATKFGYAPSAIPGVAPASRMAIMTSLENSLRRLGTDHVDLYQLHRADAATPWEETLRALQDMIRSGKVRFIGASNLSALQMVEAKAVATSNGLPVFITQQNEFSLLRQAAAEELLPTVWAQDAGFIPYFPLANGMLSGKYRVSQPPAEQGRLSVPGKWQSLYVTEHDLAAVARLQQYAQTHGHSVLELAVAWLTSQAVVTSVISGATLATQVRQNAAAAAWTLSPDELSAVGAIPH